MTTGITPGEYESSYDALVKAPGISPVSRAPANALVDRMLQAAASSKTSDITKRIAEAAASGNTAMIFSLTDELKAHKDAEQARTSQLLDIAKNFTFSEVLRAFSGEYRELVFELAILSVRSSEEALTKPRKRSASNGTRQFRDTGPLYIISHNGKQIEARKNVGSPKLPGAEKEFYEFMGFDVSEDGRTLTPPTFTNKHGEVVQSNSKKNIINDLLAGSKLWADRGFRIKVKETVAA